MRFIFDENLGHQLSDGMRAFGEDACHLLEYFDPGTPDEIWLEKIGKNGWFLITLDRRIRRRPIEKEALIKHKVGAFFLEGKSMSRWNYVVQVVKSWEKIKSIAEKETPPFTYQVNRHGTDVGKIPLS